MAKRTKKSARKTTRSRAPAIGRISTEQLARELRRRKGQLTKLHARHDALRVKIDALDEEIDILRGMSGVGARRPTRATGRGRGGRRKGPDGKSLADVLAQVLNGRQLSVTEAVEVAKHAGYRTGSEHFYTIVNQTLLKDQRFRKVSRGIYTAVK